MALPSTLPVNRVSNVDLDGRRFRITVGARPVPLMYLPDSELGPRVDVHTYGCLVARGFLVGGEVRWTANYPETAALRDEVEGAVRAMVAS